MKTKDTVALAWIDPGHVEGMFAVSMVNLYAARSAQIGTILRVEASGLLSRARNEIAAAFLDQTDCQWILMMDTDETITVEDFDNLTSAAHDKRAPLVSGLVFAAYPNPESLYPSPIPTIYRIEPSGYAPVFDYPSNEVIPIDASGTGCLLVHRSVFARMRQDATEHEGPDCCWFQDLPVNGRWFSEDLYFCRKAKSYGFRQVAHTGVVLQHRKRYWLNENHFRHFQGLMMTETLAALKVKLRQAIDAGDQEAAAVIRAEIERGQALAHPVETATLRDGTPPGERLAI